MKKVFYVAAILGVASLTSCVKTWDCKCTSTNAYVTASNKVTAKKKDAKAACDSWQTTYKQYDPNATCELK
ncbi:MAG: hypothetical protein H3C31_01970 [Brumimicrobium sp.]|nr:hypothetical protein [Brumimicrobium sp.]